MSISAERVTEIAQAASDYLAKTFVRDRQPIPLDGNELLEICALAAAGRDAFVKIMETVSQLKLSPGDLMTVRIDAEQPGDLDAIRAGLSAVSHAYNVRVVALPTTARVEVVGVDELNALLDVTLERVATARDPGQRARMFTEAASSAGIILQRVAPH